MMIMVAGLRIGCAMTHPNDPDEYYEAVWDVTRATLDKMAAADLAATNCAVSNWLWDRRAHLPRYPEWLDDRVRDQARYWAEHARTEELEAYMLAAAMKLEGGKSMFHRRHIKRLVASLWRRMWPEDQAAFIEWAKENGNGRKS